MLSGHCRLQGGRQRRKLLRIRVEWHLKPVRHQRVESAILAPVFQNLRLFQKFAKNHLMVSHEKNRLMRVGTIDQMIEYFTRSRTPVDIVAQKDKDRPHYGISGEIGIYS